MDISIRILFVALLSIVLRRKQIEVVDDQCCVDWVFHISFFQIFPCFEVECVLVAFVCCDSFSYSLWSGNFSFQMVLEDTSPGGQPQCLSLESIFQSGSLTVALRNSGYDINIILHIILLFFGGTQYQQFCTVHMIRQHLQCKRKL